MTLTLKQALTKLDSKSDTRLYFFFCEKAENGKPRVIADTRKIDPKKHEEAQALMATAQAKGMCRGAMQMVEGTLHLTPTKGGVAGRRLETGVTLAARTEGVLSKILGIHVGDEEDDEPEVPTQQAQAAPTPAAPIGQHGPRGLPSDYVTEDEDEGAPPPTVAARVINTLPADYEEDLDFEPTQNTYFTGEADTGVTAAPKRPPPPKLTRERIDAMRKKADQAKAGGTAVRHDDPLAKAHPVLGQLHARKLEAAKRLKLLLEEPEPDAQAVALAEAELDKLDLWLEQAQRKLNATGVNPKSIGAEYAGEDQMNGWRAGPRPERGKLTEDEYRKKLDKWERLRQDTSVVTEYLTPEQRKARELHADPDGLLHDAGHKPMKGSVGYVMDADEQKLYAFTGGMRHENKQEIRTHHSSMLAGADVTGAGEITFNNGRIVGISNASGHYKPRTTHLLQTIETLLKQGLLLDTTYMMLDPDTGKGKPLEGKARELYEKTLKAQQRIEQRKARLGELERAVDVQARKVEGLCDPEGKPLPSNHGLLEGETKELQRLTQELLELDRELAEEIERVGKARQLLGKLGAAPANKLTEVKVTNLDINESMRGIQVMDARRSAQSVDLSEFVRSGGGNEVQAGLKTDMQEELLSKTREKRKMLDQLAEKRAARWDPQRALKRLQDLKRKLGEADPDSPSGPALLRELERCERLLKRPDPPPEEALETAMEGLDTLDQLWQQAQSKQTLPQDVHLVLKRVAEDLGYGNYKIYDA